MLEYEALLEEKRLLDKKLANWRSKELSPCVCLIKAHARNRLHPYLYQGEPITRPSHYQTTEPFTATPQTFTMSLCLSIDAQAGELESQRPWYKEHWGVKYSFPDAEFQHRCTYCHGRGHALPECDRPHSKCHTLPPLPHPSLPPLSWGCLPLLPQQPHHLQPSVRRRRVCRPRR
jgi:hypothetical protein